MVYARTKLVVLLITLACLMPLNVQAGGTAFDTLSASVAARGWAVVADLPDASTVWFNPAGMAYLKNRFNIYVAASLVFPKIRYKDPEGNRPSSNGANKFTAVPAIYLTGSWGDRKQFSAGISLVFPFGLASKYEPDWTGNTLVVLSKLQAYWFTPAFAWRINKYISIGASINLILATVVLKRGLGLPGPDGVIGGKVHMGGGPNFAIAGNFGIQVRPYKGLRLGLVYKSRSKMKMTGKANFEAPAPYDQGLLDQDIKATLGTPDNIWLGIGYHFNSKVYLELDIRFTMWKYTNKEIILEFSKPLNGTIDEQRIQTRWENSWTFYLGGWYKPIKELKIRYSVGFDMTPIKDMYLGPLVPDSSRVLIGLGLGYVHEGSGFYADLAYNAVIFLPREVSSASNQDGFAQKWNNQVHLVTLGLGWQLK